MSTPWRAPPHDTDPKNCTLARRFGSVADIPLRNVMKPKRHMIPGPEDDHLPVQHFFVKDEHIMATYEVYHALEQHQPLMQPSGIQRASYQQVAEVDAEDLDQVFLLTNYVDHPWQEHCQVRPTTPTIPQRSTSVGDLISQSGQLWMVANLGFIEVWWEDHE